MKTEGEIKEIARRLSNITHDRPIDLEERYYNDYKMYDGVISGYLKCQEENKNISILFTEWLMDNCELSKDKTLWSYNSEDYSIEKLFELFTLKNKK